MYKEGIFDSNECGANLDHAVTAVGYGEENKKEYFIIRNSWGPSWSE
jgi:cathepsin L